MKTKMLILGNYPPPYGGVPTFTYGFSKFLYEKGHEVTIYSRKFKRDTAEGGIKSFGLQKYSKIKVLLASLRHLQFIIMFYRIALSDVKEFVTLLLFLDKIVQNETLNQNLVVFSFHVYPNSMIAFYLYKKYNIRYNMVTFGEFYRNPNEIIKFRREYKKVIENARSIQSCSIYCASYASEFLSKLEVDATIEPNRFGIDINSFKNERMTQRCLKKTTPTLLFVGRMTYEMGLHLILEAFPKVVKSIDIKLCIVGRTGELTGDAHRLATDYPKNVTVHENVSFQMLCDQYKLADLTIIPSINERACLGLSIIEAIVSGSAVLYSDKGGGPEAANDYPKAFPFNPDDAAELPKIIISTLDKLSSVEVERKVYHDFVAGSDEHKSFERAYKYV